MRATGWCVFAQAQMRQVPHECQRRSDACDVQSGSTAISSRVAIFDRLPGCVEIVDRSTSSESDLAWYDACRTTRKQLRISGPRPRFPFQVPVPGFSVWFPCHATLNAWSFSLMVLFNTDHRPSFIPGKRHAELSAVEINRAPRYTPQFGNSFARQI